MKLKDWFKAKKQKREAKRQAKLERRLAAENLDNIEGEGAESIERKLAEDVPELKPLGAQTEGIEQPESRFTEEYREFLKRQEEAGANRAVTREEF